MKRTQREREQAAANLLGPVNQNLRCVIYRTGGTDNFKWRRTLAMTPEEAEGALASVMMMGYVCNIENYFASLAIGLPETFSPDFPLIKEWH